MNGNIDYKIGEITQGFKNLEDRMSRYEEINNTDHKEIKEQLFNLNMWRWKVVGGSVVIVSILNIAWDLIKKNI